MTTQPGGRANLSDGERGGRESNEEVSQNALLAVCSKRGRILVTLAEAADAAALQRRLAEARLV